MKPRMVEVSKYDGKTWVPSGTAVFHGFFSDYEEFHEGPGNYPAALIEWEDGRVESVVARSIRFLVPTLEAEKIKDQIIRENLGKHSGVEGSWLSKEMQTPPKGFSALKDHHVEFDGVKVSLYRRDQGDGVNPATMSLEPVEEPLGSWEPIATAPRYTEVLCRYECVYRDYPFHATQDSSGGWVDRDGNERHPDVWFMEAPK